MKSHVSPSAYSSPHTASTVLALWLLASPASGLGDEIIIRSSCGVTLQQQLGTLEHSVKQCKQNGKLVLAEFPEGTCPVGLAETLSEGAGQVAFFVEGNRRIRVPESESCGAPEADLGTQQCTIGFVDGNPATGAYLLQERLHELELENSHEHNENRSAPIVAVIDTGVDLNHASLQPSLFSDGWDFLRDEQGAAELLDGIDNDQDGVVDESYGHGTHIAGTIAVICPQALIVPYRVADADGVAQLFDVYQAIIAAVDDGADLINLSLSTTTPSGLLDSAISYAQENRVSVFTSAGNTGLGQVLFPAASSITPAGDDAWDRRADYIYAVAALDSLGNRAAFSSYGPGTDLCAPGTEIYSTFPGGGFAWWSGTSMACAVACGSGALLHSASNNSGPGDLSPCEWLLITGKQDHHQDGIIGLSIELEKAVKKAAK